MCSRPCQTKKSGVTGVHVDDFLRKSECLTAPLFEVKREFDFGAWDVGDMKFEIRQLTQMTNIKIGISFSTPAELQSLHTNREHDVLPCCARDAMTIRVTTKTL